LRTILSLEKIDRKAWGDEGGDFFNYRVLHQVVCFLFSVKKAGAGASLAQQKIGSAGFQPVPFRVRTAEVGQPTRRSFLPVGANFMFAPFSWANPRFAPTEKNIHLLAICYDFLDL
jgi:hypothetical protein